MMGSGPLTGGPPGLPSRPEIMGLGIPKEMKDVMKDV
jgi:hypothetical protein